MCFEARFRFRVAFKGHQRDILISFIFFFGGEGKGNHCSCLFSDFFFGVGGCPY